MRRRLVVVLVSCAIVVFAVAVTWQDGKREPEGGRPVRGHGGRGSHARLPANVDAQLAIPPQRSAKPALEPACESLRPEAMDPLDCLTEEERSQFYIREGPTPTYDQWPANDPNFRRMWSIGYSNDAPSVKRSKLFDLLSDKSYPEEFRDEVELEIALTYYQDGDVDRAVGMARQIGLKYPHATYANAEWKKTAALYTRLNPSDIETGDRSNEQLQRIIDHQRAHPNSMRDEALVYAAFWLKLAGRVAESETIYREIFDRQGAHAVLGADVQWVLGGFTQTMFWATDPLRGSDYFPVVSYDRPEDRAAAQLARVYTNDRRMEDLKEVHEFQIQKWSATRPVPMLINYARDLTIVGDMESARAVLNRALVMAEGMLSTPPCERIDVKRCKDQVEWVKRELAVLDGALPDQNPPARSLDELRKSGD